jgi:hypothetical protein
MPGDLKTKYGSNNQAITITLNSLASSATAGRESTVIDNTVNLFYDALVQVILSFPNLAPANDKAVYVYAYASANGGTNYTGGATGTDAAYTQDDPTVLRLIGVIPVPTQNKSYVGGPFSVAQAFGGVLPASWGLFVRNYAGQTLNASGNSAFYQGVLGQYT